MAVVNPFMPNKPDVPEPESVNAGNQQLTNPANAFPPPSQYAQPQQNSNMNPGMLNPMQQTMSPVGQGQPGQQTNQQKYRIIDIGYYFNEEALSGNKQLGQGEGFLTVVAYNADFNDVKIKIHGFGNGAFGNNAVFLSNLPMLGTGTIYPGFMHQYLFAEPGTEIKCYDVLITNTGANWQNNLPDLRLLKEEDSVKITINSNRGTAFVELKGWQKKAFDANIKWAIEVGPMLALAGNR